jgi:hypothetical protein
VEVLHRAAELERLQHVAVEIDVSRQIGFGDAPFVEAPSGMTTSNGSEMLAYWAANRPSKDLRAGGSARAVSVWWPLNLVVSLTLTFRLLFEPAT